MDELLNKIKSVIETGILYFVPSETVGIVGTVLYFISPKEFLLPEGTTICAPSPTTKQHLDLIDLFEETSQKISENRYQTKRDLYFDSTYKAACFICGDHLYHFQYSWWSFENQVENYEQVYNMLSKKFNLDTYPWAFRIDLRDVCQSCFISFCKQLLSFEKDEFVTLTFALFELYEHYVEALCIFRIRDVTKQEFNMQDYFSLICKLVYHSYIVTSNEKDFLLNLNPTQQYLVSLFFKRVYYSKVPLFKLMQMISTWKQNVEEINFENVVQSSQKLIQHYGPLLEEDVIKRPIISKRKIIHAYEKSNTSTALWKTDIKVKIKVE